MTSGKAKSMTVRHPQYTHEELPQHYFNNNPILTHLLNSLHTIFPEGERFFIRTVKKYHKESISDMLNQDIRLFIGQEIVHGKQHEKLFAILDDQGLEATTFAAWYKKAAYGKGFENIVKQTVSYILNEKKADAVALATTAGIEHYTASLAELVLRNKETILRGMPDDMAKMLLWHSMEEIEHKSVTFDLLKEVDADYQTRMVGYALAALTLGTFIAAGWLWFLSKDKKINILRLPGDIISAAVLGVRVLPQLFASLSLYVDPRFHPDQIVDDVSVETL